MASTVRSRSLHFTIEIEQETDGRFLAEIPQLSGVMAYGASAAEAAHRAQALALRVVAEQIEHGEVGSEYLTIAFHAA
jgi:predicted RNase H-like HicB family nuclease